MSSTSPAKPLASGSHTPGDWHCTKDSVLPGQLAVIDEIGSYVIAAIDDDEQGQANARLIAAAPELLEVLSELVNSPNAKQNAMWDKARAAITRATKE